MYIRVCLSRVSVQALAFDSNVTKFEANRTAAQGLVAAPDLICGTHTSEYRYCNVCCLRSTLPPEPSRVANHADSPEGNQASYAPRMSRARLLKIKGVEEPCPNAVYATGDSGVCTESSKARLQLQTESPSGFRTG